MASFSSGPITALVYFATNFPMLQRSSECYSERLSEIDNKRCMCVWYKWYIFIGGGDITYLNRVATNFHTTLLLCWKCNYTGALKKNELQRQILPTPVIEEEPFEENPSPCVEHYQKRLYLKKNHCLT